MCIVDFFYYSVCVCIGWVFFLMFCIGFVYGVKVGEGVGVLFQYEVF